MTRNLQEAISENIRLFNKLLSIKSNEFVEEFIVEDTRFYLELQEEISEYKYSAILYHDTGALRQVVIDYSTKDPADALKDVLKENGIKIKENDKIYIQDKVGVFENKKQVNTDIPIAFIPKNRKIKFIKSGDKSNKYYEIKASPVKPMFLKSLGPGFSAKTKEILVRTSESKIEYVFGDFSKIDKIHYSGDKILWVISINDIQKLKITKTGGIVFKFLYINGFLCRKK